MFVLIWIGIVKTHISYISKSCEGNWSTKWDIEHYEPTCVWVNGREVHPLDLDHFKRLRLPIRPVEKGEPAEFWVIDENGEITPELDQSIAILKRADSSVVFVSVGMPKWVSYSAVNSQESKRNRFRSKFASLKGDSGDGFFVYDVSVSCGDTKLHSECRFEQFENFHTYVRGMFIIHPGVLILYFEDTKEL